MHFAERRLWALWTCLRSYRSTGQPFRRQQPKQGFITNFSCHAARLIVEVAGPIHLYQGAYDAERELKLTAAGERILRVTNAEVFTRLPEVLARIRSAVKTYLSQTIPPVGCG